MPRYCETKHTVFNQSPSARESNRASERYDRKTHIADVFDHISPLKTRSLSAKRAKNRGRSTISHQRPSYLAVERRSCNALRQDPPFIKTCEICRTRSNEIKNLLREKRLKRRGLNDVESIGLRV